MFRGLCVLLMALLPGLALAQGLPEPTSDHVTDLGDLLSPAAEERITATLQEGREETGVHVTILTLDSLANHGGEGQRIEDYAKAVFNAWGVGDPVRHDGVLILVARDDRAARIALGSGYDAIWDGQAQRVIDTALLPAFRDGRYEEGLEAAAAATLERVARPWAAALPPPPEAAPQDGPGGWIVAGLALVAGAAIALRRRIGDAIGSWKPCPRCGARGLSRSREETLAATANTAGSGILHLRCPRCGHQEDRPFSIPAKRGPQDRGGGFGGGRSSGGGATGRW